MPVCEHSSLQQYVSAQRISRLHLQAHLPPPTILPSSHTPYLLPFPYLLALTPYSPPLPFPYSLPILSSLKPSLFLSLLGEHPLKVQLGGWGLVM